MPLSKTTKIAKTTLNIDKLVVLPHAESLLPDRDDLVTEGETSGNPVKESNPDLVVVEALKSIVRELSLSSADKSTISPKKSMISRNEMISILVKAPVKSRMEFILETRRI